MNIQEFFSQYTNHPVLFVGTGISLRYLSNSHTWDSLLKKISYDIHESNEPYLDIKSSCEYNGKYKYEEIASKIETQFNKYLKENRNGKFKEINDLFYEKMENGINLSRFKMYICECFKDL